MSDTTEQEPTAETRADTPPRIYVASLSDYNAGTLHGVWLQADQDPDDIREGIGKMLADSPTTRRYGDVAEEYAIHDYENFGAVRLDENEPIDRVTALARGISTHGTAFAYWWEMDPPAETSDDTELGAAFEEHYLGDYDSVTEYGRQLLDDLGFDPDELPGIPEGLRPYVSLDVEAWVRDMQYGGEIRTAPSERGVHVFSCF